MLKVTVNNEVVKVTFHSTIESLKNEFATGWIKSESTNLDTGTVSIRMEVRGKFGWETKQLVIEAVK
jgi:hypothetical protein